MSTPSREQIVQAVRDKLAKSFSNDSVAYCIQVMAVDGFSPDEIRTLLKECEPKAPQPDIPKNDCAATPAETEYAKQAEPVVPPEPVNPILQAALRCVELGWFVFALRERGKQPDSELAPHGFNSSTNDPDVVRSWFANKSPNYGIDLGRSNLTVLDFDKGMPTGLELPNTLQVSTSRGVHVYFQGVSKQGNLHLGGQHVGEIKSAGGYVLGPGCVHPDGPVYTVVLRAPVAPTPSLDSFRPTDGNAKATPRNERGLIPQGSIHRWMLTKAGQGRQLGMEFDELESWLLRQVHENCEPPIDDEKVTAMAKSVCGLYEPGEDHTLILNQKAAPQATPAQSTPPAEPLNIPAHPYPQFPTWVMEGTSIYENFVKPVCAVNSRVDYFMWMPTAAMMMNYLGTKVRVPLKKWKPSFYLVLIGEKTRAHKSSSMKDGMQFLEFAGVLTMYSKEVKNAEGRSIVWEVGSPEGLGTDMQRVNCKNAILFYDELSGLISKCHIEGSGMMGALLKMYESANFSNSVKTKKDAFAVAPDSYVTSLITATTDERFKELWGQLAGDDTGLNERFTFVLQPKQLPDEELESAVPFQAAASETRKLIDKAVNQGVYNFDFGFDGEATLKECMKTCGGRVEIRAEKWALYFAVDLGKSVIDTECIDRGVAMARYERAVKKYLATEDAESKLAGLQQKMVSLLERSANHTLALEVFRAKTGERKYGTKMWGEAFGGLVGSDVITYNPKTGPQGSVTLIRQWGEPDE